MSGESAAARPSAGVLGIGWPLRPAPLREHLVGVLPEPRRGRAHPPRGVGELGDDAGHLQRPPLDVVRLHDHLARVVLRVGGDVGHRVDAPDGHARGLEGRDHRVDRTARGPVADRGVDLLDTRHPAVVAGEAGIGREIGAPDRLHQPPEDAVAVARHQHVRAVGTRIGVARRDAGQRAARGTADDAERVVLGQQALHHVEHALVERDVDDLPLPAVDLAMAQRRQHADHAVQRGQRVADRDAHAHRHPTGLGREVTQTTHRLAEHAEAGLARIRAGLPEARDAQHDQPGIERVQRVPAEPPALQGAGLEVLDQHVGLGRERAHRLLALGRAQVERHRALVARLHLPPHRGAVAQQPPGAQRIAALDRLDLDDVGAEVGERLAGERPGDQLAELEHLQAVQCVHAGFLVVEAAILPPRCIVTAGLIAGLTARCRSGHG